MNDNAFRIKFPNGSQLHDVINVSKLTPYTKSNRDQVDIEPELVSGFEEFEVEDILDHQLHYGKTRFLVKWKGYSDLHNSW